MKIMFEDGPARCRVCSWECWCVLEFDAHDVEYWEHIRENMECWNCRNWTLEMTEPPPRLREDAG